MINWDRLQILRDHLTGFKSTKTNKFDMKNYLSLLDTDGLRTSWNSKGPMTIGQVRKTCGTAVCMAGDALMLFASENSIIKYDLDHGVCMIDNDTFERASRNLLGLTWEESEYVFHGFWTKTPLAKIKKSQAVAYLSKAIANHDLNVRLSGNQKVFNRGV